MNIDEAIKHCEDVVEEAKATPCIKGGLVSKCADEHRQLAEWLKELKAYRDMWDKVIEDIGELDDRMGWINVEDVIDIIEKYKKEIEE